MTAEEAAEILEGELESLSSARGSDYSGVLALKHAISVLQELHDEQAVRQNIRQQMVSTVAESLNKVISGINSTEICNQIVSDNLRNWCERTQCKLRIAMNYLPYQGKALSSAQPEIIHCLECEYGEQDEDGWWFCRNIGGAMGDSETGSGFCSDAERRKNERSD